MLDVRVYEPLPMVVAQEKESGRYRCQQRSDYEYVCFNCPQKGHMVKDYCPHVLNCRRSKANKNKFWKCVEDGTDFSEVMITPSEVMKTRPPPLAGSSDDEDYVHALVCKGLTWDEPLALEIM